MLINSSPALKFDANKHEDKILTSFFLIFADRSKSNRVLYSKSENEANIQDTSDIVGVEI